MSSTRKRAAIHKANAEADHLRQKLMLAEHHGSVIKLMAEEMARRCDAMAGVIRELADTEIAGMACAGSDAPVEDILGRMFRLVPPNDRVEGRDADLSRRVPSHDGLCGNGNYNERTEK